MRCIAGITLVLATLVAASPVAVEQEERDLHSCNGNLALSVVKLLKATKFCSSFLHISTSTKTVGSTSTVVVPATSTTTSTVVSDYTNTVTQTNTATSTSTVSVAGPTVTSTSTSIAGTITITITASTATVTSTVTSTTTSYAHNGGPLKRAADNFRARADPAIPSELKSFASAIISTACSCYVTAPTVTVTSVTSITSTSTQVSVITVSTSSADATVTFTVFTTVDIATTITGPTSTITTDTITTPTTSVSITATTTATTTTTTTVAGPSFNFVQAYSSGCVPYNYLTLDIGISVPNYQAAFQYCAKLCESEGNCVQIFVGYDTSAGGGPYTCLTGGGPADKTWTASEIQCNLPNPYPQYGIWYSSPA